MDRWMHPHFPKGWPKNSEELPRSNTYIRSDQDIQWSTTQPHKNPKLRTYLGKIKMAFGEIDPRRHKF